MNDKPLRLSLVVPIYNVAAYLPACLDSLAAQTLAPDEIIAVDDGSTDACPQILADYVRRMPNLRIVRQENGGLSAARNTGLDLARGKWLAFVDSDDFVAPDMYQRLVELAEADDLDMALCNAWYHFEGREPERPIYADTVGSGAIPGREWLRRRLEGDRLLHMVWMHLYRRDFIEAHAFRFVPRLIHEDVIWTTRALLAAERVRFDPAPLYHYRIPIRRFTPEQSEKRLLAIVDSSVVNARTLGEIADAEADPAFRRLLDAQLVDGGLSVFHKLERLPAAVRRERYRQLRRDGYFGLLWRHAVGWRQRRRIVRNYLTSLIAAGCHDS